MAFADFNWATDVNYPAGAATWSGTTTKVAPAAGVQADGFRPTDRPPAQWINWLFNSVVTSGQALETLVGNATLQRAWDRSEAIGAATHINVGTQDLVIGGTAGAILTADNTSRRVTLPGELRLRGVDIAVTAAGVYTPVVNSVSGPNADIIDIGNGIGIYTRVGDFVSFSMSFSLSKLGWTNAFQQFNFSLPVARITDFTADNQLIAAVSVDYPGQFDSDGSILDAHWAEARVGHEELEFTVRSINTLTARVFITGHYTLTT
jgi:hypothetical protein